MRRIIAHVECCVILHNLCQNEREDEDWIEPELLDVVALPHNDDNLGSTSQQDETVGKVRRCMIAKACCNTN